MKAYGEVAVTAVRLCAKLGHDPRTAWNTAASQQFPLSASLQAKSCPRGAFFGLCAADLVRGVKAQGSVGRLGKNAQYAIDAVRFLRAAKATNLSPLALWREVGRGKAHNSQMDVVLALWSRGLIQGS